jgi:hypothetical protein
MEETVFEALANAAHSALVAAGVAQGRVFHIYPDEPALRTSAVTLGVESATPDSIGLSGHPIDWTVALRVDCYARFGVNNQQPHVEVTQLYAAAYKALMSDTTLGGLVLGIEPGPASWNYADDERQLALVSSTFAVLLRTGAANLIPA